MDDNGVIKRASFSKSLLEFISRKTGYKLRSIKIDEGKYLTQGTESTTGYYALISAHSKKILRVEVNKETAELLCDYQSRYLAECHITFIDTP